MSAAAASSSSSSSSPLPSIYQNDIAHFRDKQIITICRKLALHFEKKWTCVLAYWTADNQVEVFMNDGHAYGYAWIKIKFVDSNNVLVNDKESFTFDAKEDDWFGNKYRSMYNSFKNVRMQGKSIDWLRCILSEVEKKPGDLYSISDSNGEAAVSSTPSKWHANTNHLETAVQEQESFVAFENRIKSLMLESLEKCTKHDETIQQLFKIVWEHIKNSYLEAKLNNVFQNHQQAVQTCLANQTCNSNSRRGWYHNWKHALDVVWMADYLWQLSNDKIAGGKWKTNQNHFFTMLAALGHDMGHCGKLSCKLPEMYEHIPQGETRKIWESWSHDNEMSVPKKDSGHVDMETVHGKMLTHISSQLLHAAFNGESDYGSKLIMKIIHATKLGSCQLNKEMMEAEMDVISNPKRLTIDSIFNLDRLVAYAVAPGYAESNEMPKYIQDCPAWLVPVVIVHSADMYSQIMPKGLAENLAKRVYEEIKATFPNDNVSFKDSQCSFMTSQDVPQFWLNMTHFLAGKRADAKFDDTNAIFQDIINTVQDNFSHTYNCEFK